MASIRKRGQNSYLIVVSRGYDYEGNRLKAAQKTVHPPKDFTPGQCKKWLNEQAVLFEREVRHDPQPVNPAMTLAAYTEASWQPVPIPVTSRTFDAFCLR